MTGPQPRIPAGNGSSSGQFAHQNRTDSTAHLSPAPPPVVDADLLYWTPDPAAELRKHLIHTYPNFALDFISAGDLERWDGVTLDPEEIARAADQDHPIEDGDGWSCGTCGLPVNGYWRDREYGDNVHHTAPSI